MTARRAAFMRRAGIMLAFVLATGCSSARPPTDTIARADATLTRAIDVKAGEFAPLELYTARGALDRARQAMQEEEYTKARRLAERALADAQLAEAKARSASAKKTTEEVQATMQSLRKKTIEKPALE